MRILGSPWMCVIMLLGFFIFVEGLHMTEHQHCRSCPPCETTEYLMAHQSQGGPTAYVKSFSPEPEIKDPVDTMPSDYQPPGTDEKEPQSLEEALTG